MGLFGKKKDFTAKKLEEARRFDTADAKRTSSIGQARTNTTSITTTVTTSGDADPAIAALFEKAFGDASPDAITAAPGESVSVTTVRHLGPEDTTLKDAIAALGFGPNASLQAPGRGSLKPDDGLSAALDTIEHDYKGKPPADAKAAITATLAEHQRTIPDQVVDMIAKAVSEGGSIDVTFGP